MRRAAACLAVALATTIGLVDVDMAVAATASPSPATPYCVRFASGYVGQTLECHASLRDAVSRATGGRVTDAPAAATEFDQSTLQQINAAGTAARKAGAGNWLLAGIVFTEPSYGGYAYLMATSPTFTTSTESVLSCQANVLGPKWVAFYGAGIAPRSVMTFNGCYYNTMGVEWYANDQNRSINSPTIPTDPDYRWFFFSNGPSRAGLLDLCRSGFSPLYGDCNFYFGNAGNPVRTSHPPFQPGDKITNCTDVIYSEMSLRWQKAVGGAISVGVEIGVTVSGGVPGAAQVEASMSASYGQEWNWSETMGKEVKVNVGPHQWAQISASPLMQEFEGRFTLANSAAANFSYGRTNWEIKDVIVSRPAPGNNLEFRIDGGLNGPDDCSASAVAARLAGTAPATPGVRYIDPPVA